MGKTIAKCLGILLFVAAIATAALAAITAIYNSEQDSAEYACANYGAILQMDHQTTSSGCLILVSEDRWLQVSRLCVAQADSDLCAMVDDYDDLVVIIEPPPKG